MADMIGSSSSTAVALAENDAQPHGYPRRVLLAVTGLSPQVVTETLYALSVVRQPAFVPTELHVITTATGAERLRSTLLAPEPGWFSRLCADYALPPIDFGEANIHVLRNREGEVLGDIRSPCDNEHAADFITERVRSFTADEHCALHVSMAGGRKTMGFYSGYALSLFGRAQDRLSHVLVSEPFEQSLDFFYPTPYSCTIEIRNSGPVDTQHATVTLADIPFVSLRHGLPAALLAGKATFNGTVTAARRALAPPALVIDAAQQRVSAGGVVLSMQRAPLALLALFARRALHEAPPFAAPPDGAPDAELGTQFLRELQAVAGRMADIGRTESRLAQGMTDDFFSQTLSRLQRCLREGLGPAAAPYLIDTGHRPRRRYRLALPPRAVRFASVGGRSETGATDA